MFRVRGCLSLGRLDMVQLMLQKGRLGDIQMVHHYAHAVALEAATAKQGLAHSMGQPKSSMIDGSVASYSAARDSAATEQVSTADSGVLPRNKEEVDFLNKQDAVRRTAAKEGPLAWVRHVYGSSTWCTSCVTADVVKGTKAPDADPASFVLTGSAVAVGEAGSTPEAVQVAATIVEDNGTSRKAVLLVPLSQAGDRASLSSVSSVQKLVTLNRARGIVQEKVDVNHLAAQRHVLTATAYSGILSTLEEICALHASSTVQYDGVLIRNPAAQMRLAQLACFRYGIDALTSYVACNSDRPEAPASEDVRLPYIPIVESAVLNMYAESTLLDGLKGALEMINRTPLSAAVPHRSKPEKLIQYPYLQELQTTSKWALMTLEGSLKEQALTFLGPVLRTSQLSAASNNQLSELLTMGGHAPRLTGVHINLSVSARALEKDIGTLLDHIAKQKDRSDPMFVIAVGQYVAELFASMAAISRCSATLNHDEEGKGHREWLLTQAFCSASCTRREHIVRDWQLAALATKALKGVDLDGYSTHPVQLMNAAPKSQKTAKASTA